jgi:hypothetical protein
MFNMLNVPISQKGSRNFVNGEFSFPLAQLNAARLRPALKLMQLIELQALTAACPRIFTPQITQSDLRSMITPA